MLPRLDRILTLSVGRPLTALLSNTPEASVPILMYHSVSEYTGPPCHPYYRTDTHPSMFRAQMEALHAAGWRTADLDAVDSAAGARRFVITFDDGYEDFYHSAFPVLQSFGYTATMFLPAAYIGESNLEFDGRRCLSWTQVRQLQGMGISFGSHTVTHPKLTQLPAEGLRREVEDSKASIEHHTGKTVAAFSYPYAYPEQDRPFRRRLDDLLERAGYTLGVSTMIGRVSARSERYGLPRLPVNTLDDPPLLGAKLAGEYDWIHAFQSLSKRLRAVS